jgi:hypothetical protein
MNGRTSLPDIHMMGLICGIYKKLKKCTKSTNNLINKWALELNRHFLNEKNIDGQYIHEKCSTSLVFS